jgi:iron-sulfur cluster repair protein YtfE (RIC family)
MAVPLDAIRAIHNAFRKDVMVIDESAKGAAHQNGDLDLLLKRYNFFNEVLVWHALGEEKFVFPVIEKVAPLISEPYEQDHRGLDSLYKRLNRAVSSSDLIEVARVTSALKFHLDIHLNKEEAHLYRVYGERISMAEQLAINGKMAGEIPQDRFPELIMWLYALIGPDDRENMTRIWQQSMPAQVFSQVAGLIRSAIGTDWKDLAYRIPDLNSIDYT